MIKIAISHYQFETIHPFLDGNGRIGRLMITLQLIESEFLNRPVLYVSNFLESHRPAYYEALDRVRQQNDLKHWLLFFLEAVIDTAQNSKKTFEAILELKESFENKVAQLGRKEQRARRLLLNLYAHPLTNVNTAKNSLQCGYATANNLIQDFVNLGILKEITGYSRNRQFIMQDYLRLFIK